jgi:hypothetical protein
MSSNDIFRNSGESGCATGSNNTIRYWSEPHPVCYAVYESTITHRKTTCDTLSESIRERMRKEGRL